MGIDVHVFNFLNYAKPKSGFQNTITIGRQGIYIPQPVLDGLTGKFDAYKTNDFCENLLKSEFDSTHVDSIDNSSYEGATIVHDMNEPIDALLHGKYDTVIDGGCLEHIFDIKQALLNCSRLCKTGGQIIHILPADNFCGHGFWQFSPELFTSLYTEKNGYRDTEVFLADLDNTSQWYIAESIGQGRRFEISSTSPVYILVRTVLCRENPNLQAQQSDYEHLWQKTEASTEQPTSSPQSSTVITYAQPTNLGQNKEVSLFERLRSKLRRKEIPALTSPKPRSGVVGKNIQLKIFTLKN